MLAARFTGAIASAVAGEVTRLDQHPDFWKCEGGAYKAAWDRLKPADSRAPGSPALNLCEAHRRDCLTFDAFRGMREAGLTILEILVVAETRSPLDRRGVRA